MSTEAMQNTELKRERGFRNDIKPIWCPGCGDHAVLASLVGALTDLALDPCDVAVITGIGCSSRLPGYMGCYGFNSIHGRAIPIATGVKMARPETTVIAAGGDGDGFSIGGCHPLHVCRRNVDLTYIVMDNGIYGLTKGQASPTTPLGVKTKTTALGAFEKPVNPLTVMLGYEASYVAQAFAGDIKYMRALFADAIKHPGFSFINVVCPCPTYRGGLEQFKVLREMVHPLTAENHDETDWYAAHKLADDKGAIHTGVLYRNERPGYVQQQMELRAAFLKGKPAPRVEDIAKIYM
jgi:2-oxoglutarate/2-oxoacid ferredoxin oxidoreductase subunit beta